MDETIYRIVMSNPIPEKLIRNISRVPLLPSYAIRRHSMNEHLTATLLDTLPFVCFGYTNREIARRRHYSEEAIKDHVKRLLGIFRARNRTHLAALAIAAGYVKL